MRTNGFNLENYSEKKSKTQNCYDSGSKYFQRVEDLKNCRSSKQKAAAQKIRKQIPKDPIQPTWNQSPHKTDKNADQKFEDQPGKIIRR